MTQPGNVTGDGGQDNTDATAGEQTKDSKERERERPQDATAGEQTKDAGKVAGEGGEGGKDAKARLTGPAAPHGRMGGCRKAWGSVGRRMGGVGWGGVCMWWCWWCV